MEVLRNDCPETFVYSRGHGKARKTKRERERYQVEEMKEATDVLKIVGIVLLALFVLAVGVPLVLAAAGVALGVLGLLIGLAIALIKIAIVVAIIYLIVVGIRAVLR
jgi:protein-S-isoprenylcysteine O-methyltransferase Ste14